MYIQVGCELALAWLSTRLSRDVQARPLNRLLETPQDRLAIRARVFTGAVCRVRKLADDVVAEELGTALAVRLPDVAVLLPPQADFVLLPLLFHASLVPSGSRVLFTRLYICLRRPWALLPHAERALHWPGLLWQAPWHRRTDGLPQAASLLPTAPCTSCASSPLLLPYLCCPSSPPPPPPPPPPSVASPSPGCASASGASYVTSLLPPSELTAVRLRHMDNCQASSTPAPSHFSHSPRCAQPVCPIVRGVGTETSTRDSCHDDVSFPLCSVSTAPLLRASRARTLLPGGPVVRQGEIQSSVCTELVGNK